MPRMRYIRPRTIAETVDLLRDGVPLAGGTQLVSRRSTLENVVDLQDLPLKALRSWEGTLEIGAMCRLQDLVDAAGTVGAGSVVPTVLVDACRGEAGWNLRNMITIGGTLASEDGRSRVLAVLTALRAMVCLEPAGDVLPAEEVLAGRPDLLEGRLITGVRLPTILRAEYQQVARAPADRPIVCAAACHGRSADGAEFLQLALGGFGDRPLGIALDLKRGGDVIEQAAGLAQEAYAEAQDAWATAEYRSHVAGVLARRVVGEVVR